MLLLPSPFLQQWPLSVSPGPPPDPSRLSWRGWDKNWPIFFQAKKQVNPPVKKSKPAPAAKKPEPAPPSKVLPLPATKPPEAAKSHPANFRPVKPALTKPTPLAKAVTPAAKASAATPPQPLAKVSQPAKKVAEPVKTPVADRLARTLIPKWTPPAMKMTSSLSTTPSTGSANPSPRIGLRVGLSRNFKPAKPLHTSFKSPD